MDPLTWLSLGLQLAALCSIVGALLLYLLRKVRVAEVLPVDSAKTVLVTSVDSALGLQIATYLSGKGWRVIAGCRQGGLGARLAESWLQAHVASTPEDQPPPRLAPLELDVAREDLLEEAARATAQHLPAGEHEALVRRLDQGLDAEGGTPLHGAYCEEVPLSGALTIVGLDPVPATGVWAVINTAGSSGRGGAACWESALRSNVLGALRVARTFSPMLAAAAADHPYAGRLFYIGLTSDTACESLSRLDSETGEGSAAAAAVRWGTWGAARALRASLRARRLHVVLLHAPDLSAAEIYAPPVQLTLPSQPSSRPETPSSDVSSSTATCAVTMPGEAAEYSAKVLPTSALKVLEEALTSPAPRDSYYLKIKQDSWFTRMPSLRVAH